MPAKLEKKLKRKAAKKFPNDKEQQMRYVFSGINKLARKRAQRLNKH